MNRSLTTLLLLTLAASEGTAQELYRLRRAAAPDGTVKITNAAGRVRLIGWDRDSVAMNTMVGEGVERVDFSGGERETRIRVVLERDAHNFEGTDLEVHVPQRSHVAVRTSSADIEITDFNGALDLESVSGDIEVSGRPWMVYAESAGGDVDIEASTKIIRAKSIDGDVTVRGARGYLEVSTVSGNADVRGERLWEGEITSVSGDIRFEGYFDGEGSFDFESHGGLIEISLPDHVAADFDIRTLSGARVHNDFGSNEDRSFAIGGGGTQIKIKSFKGNVRLLRSK